MRSRRYFRLLLRLLPASFRERHGGGVLSEWERMRAELGPSPGRLRLLAFYAAVTWDVLRPRFGMARNARIGDALRADARFAFRQYGRRWATTLTMLGILSAGMAIPILLFSFVHSYAVLPPPGIERADDLVRIRGSQVTSGGLRGRYFDAEELEAYRDLEEPFRAVAGWATTRAVLEVPGRAETVDARAEFVTDGFFPVLGMRPILGPGLPRDGGDDASLAPVAVVGYPIWDRLLGRSAEVIGSTLDLNGVSVTVVGVAPPQFQGIGAVADFKLWLPVTSRHALLAPPVSDGLRFGAVARLRPEVGLERVTSAAQVVAARAQAFADERSVPNEDREFRAEVVRTMNGDPHFERDTRLLALSLGGLAVLVLLITCTNVSALLMGLAMARRHEIVVRLSLGASRGRVVRQLLTESGALAIVAGGTALGLAGVVLRLVTTYVTEIPLQLEITWPAAWFTLGTALLVGVGFGLAPALHATRLAFSRALKDSATAITGSRLRLQRALVVVQVALTQPFVVAVVATVLFAYANLRPASPGDLDDRLVSVQLVRIVNDPWSVDPAGVEARHALEMARLRSDLEVLTGVTAVVPAGESLGEIGPYESEPDDRVAGVDYAALTFAGFTGSPGGFSARGIPVLMGRDFQPTDPDASHLRSPDAILPVVVPSEVARRFWAGADPIGRRLRPATEDAGTATLVVVGVVPTPDRGGQFAGERQIYLARDTARTPRGLTLRTATDAAALLPAIRRIAADDAPTAQASVRTMETIQEGFWSMFRRVTAGLLAAGALTLLLSAIGLYAVVAFAVGQRRGEIAVRMACGAPAERVAAGILGSGLKLGGLGLAIGLPLSLVGVHLWNTLPDPDIPEVSLPWVAVLVAVLAVVTALVASWVPARRAAAVDPAAVLRTE